jgi:SprT protein
MKSYEPSGTEPQVIARTMELLRQAEEHFQIGMPRVAVRFDLRGRSAGMVRFAPDKPPEVRYNRLLLEENGADFLARTVPHEVAHVVARALFGAQIKPHGAEWKRVMYWLGADASRCHDYDVSRTQSRRLQRFPYRCACRRHWLTSIRHKRIIAGQTYYCQACKNPLRPAEPEVAAGR